MATISGGYWLNAILDPIPRTFPFDMESLTGLPLGVPCSAGGMTLITCVDRGQSCAASRAENRECHNPFGVLSEARSWSARGALAHARWPAHSCSTATGAANARVRAGPSMSKSSSGPPTHVSSKTRATGGLWRRRGGRAHGDIVPAGIAINVGACVRVLSFCPCLVLCGADLFGQNYGAGRVSMTRASVNG